MFLRIRGLGFVTPLLVGFCQLDANPHVSKKGDLGSIFLNNDW